MKHKYTLYFRFMQFEGIGFFVVDGKGLRFLDLRMGDEQREEESEEQSENEKENESEKTMAERDTLSLSKCSRSRR